MDSNRFQEAQQAYDAGDFRTAAKGFLAAAGRGAEGNGAAYHMAGNALIRLRRHQDAITVYNHALRDALYDRRGAVFANLGAAYVALAEYVEAVKAYESALAEHDYTTPHKALQGMAGALLERGRVEEAASAYRKAALAQGNPDPGKALVNLGLCFMALGRPLDAAEAYKAALGFEQYQGRGKALANLGQAYVAAGQYPDAVKAFEKATQLHGHRLSSAAQQAYDAAVEAVRPRHEVVDGWETGELPPIVGPAPSASADGWDTGELRALTGVEPAPAPAPAPARASLGPIITDPADTFAAHPQANRAAETLGIGDEEAVADFFAVTEEEMRQRDREARRQERQVRREQTGIVKPLLAGIVALVLLFAVLGGAYAMGFGWPTQGSTVTRLLDAHGKGESVYAYWAGSASQTDVDKAMSKVRPPKEFTVDSIVRHARTSTAIVTVTPRSAGAAQRYSVTLSREGVGWKVTAIEFDFGSTGR